MARIANLEGKTWHMLSWGAPATYKQDGLLSVHATGFDRDPRFHEAYAKGRQPGLGVFRKFTGGPTLHAGPRSTRSGSARETSSKPVPTAVGLH